MNRLIRIFIIGVILFAVILFLPLTTAIPESNIEEQTSTDWPMLYGIIWGKIEHLTVFEENGITYIEFHAKSVYFFGVSYGFGGDQLYFDHITDKWIRSIYDVSHEFIGFYTQNYIFGRFHGRY